MKDSIFSPGERGEKLIRVNDAGFAKNPAPRHHARGAGFCFLYIMSGEAAIESPNTLVSAGPGRVVIIHDSEECVVYKNSGDLSLIRFSVSGFITEAVYEVLGLDRIAVFPADRLITFTKLEREYAEYLAGSGKAGQRICEAAFSLMLDCAGYSKRDSDARPIAKRMREFLDLSVCEDIDLDMLGAHFDITGVHAIRVFRKEYDITPMQYLRDARLNAAAQMLRMTDIHSSVIAETLRFSNPQHFSNAFKEKFGISPGRYRESVRGN